MNNLLADQRGANNFVSSLECRRRDSEKMMIKRDIFRTQLDQGLSGSAMEVDLTSSRFDRKIRALFDLLRAYYTSSYKKTAKGDALGILLQLCDYGIDGVTFLLCEIFVCRAHVCGKSP
jgi:hypothetical protein